jgi:glycosyltransferase involved in cell wall biosynthesis
MVVRTTGNMDIDATIDRPKSSRPPAAESISREFRPRHLVVYLPALIGGGAERVAALLASGLSAAGHHITLVVDFDAPHNAHFVDANVERVTLGRSAKRGVAHARDVLRLANFLTQRKPDLVLAIGAATNIKLALAHLLARLSAKLHTRIVFSYHGPSNFGSGRLGWSAYPLASLLTRYAPMTVCVSDELVRHLVDDWGADATRTIRIYNPIAIDLTKPVRDAAELAARPPVIVALGRLSAQKDFATLLRAFAMLRRPDVRLAIYGEGPERADLEQLAEQLGVAERIDWCGYIREPWNGYASGRCLVLSSRNESFGNVVVEALASGIGVVSTACGGPSEILDGGRFGLLVPIGDAAALGDAMARTLEKPGDPAPRIARAQHFAVPTITERYLAMFEDVLSA